MVKGIIIIAIACLILPPNPLYSQEIWAGKDGNIRNVDTRAMISDQGELYLATKSELYRQDPANGRWESVFSLPAGENEIRCLGGTAKGVFLGMKRGLLRSVDRGKSWKNVFKTILPEKNNVAAIEASRHDPDKLVIATEKGLFASADAGDSWEEITGNLKTREIRCVALNKDYIYAGGDGGLYVTSGRSGGWERIYVTSALEKSEAETPQDPAETEEGTGAFISCIAMKDGALYIGIGKNILSSGDNGKNWSSFSYGGLAGSVNYILISRKSDEIYCATTKGVFEFKKDRMRWLELYRGMQKTLSVNSLVFDSNDEKRLWALTNKGLYRLEGARYAEDSYIDVERNLKKLKIVFDSEPTCEELQKAALKFADLGPEKIARWRKESKLRALLPRVSVGIDKNRSTNDEIYTSATKDYIVVGPDDVTNGFDISVSWELGDLIWSDDQTNIDVRSRLNTQLRNDVLDDLRRAYFERKRLQYEIIMAPPKDAKLRFEKTMRIEELTRAIDDLTGNYLSERMRAEQQST